MIRRSIVAVAAAIALALSLVAPAFAAPKPKIVKIEPEAVPPGRPVEIHGENIPAEGVEVTVTLDGAPALILQREANLIRIAVPEKIAPGKRAIVVTVGSDTSNKVDVKVMDEKESAAQKAKDAEREAGDPGVAREKVILLDAPQLQGSVGSAMAILFGGQADLPDGASLSVRLVLGTETVDSTTASVSSKRFTGTLGPYAKPLFAGEYWVEAHFSLSEQTKRVKAAFKKMFPEKADQDKRMVGVDRQPFRVGTAGDVESQAREVKDHFASMIQKLRDGLRDLEAGYASALRSSFREKDGKVDEDGWEKWLAGRTLAGVPEGERPKRLREFRGKKDFLNANGGFADAKWREWLDPKRDEIAGFAKTHGQLRERFFNYKDQESLKRLDAAFENWQKLSRVRSRELYQRNNLPIPDKDPETRLELSSAALAESLGDIEKRLNPIEK